MKKMIFGLGLLFSGNLALAGLFMAAIIQNKLDFASVFNTVGFVHLYFLFCLVLVISGLVISIKEAKKP